MEVRTAAHGWLLPKAKNTAHSRSGLLTPIPPPLPYNNSHLRGAVDTAREDGVVADDDGVQEAGRSFVVLLERLTVRTPAWGLHHIRMVLF